MKDNLKICTIGGGTGNSILLKGIKHWTNKITAIVTVADDGGGSGRLRQELGMPPPGDIRACLISLANIEPTMEKLLNYRFEAGGLKGQSLGNLMIAAMNNIYGDFNVAIKEMSNVLAITGKVLPVTLEDVVLFAELENGQVIEGESNITRAVHRSASKIKRVYLKPEAPKPLDESIQDLLEADLIFIGPGSLFTSIMPNLLIEEIVEALKKTRARVYYVANIFMEAGETAGFSVTDHVAAIDYHVKKRVIDGIVVNTTELAGHEDQILLDQEEAARLEEQGYHLIQGDFIDLEGATYIHKGREIMRAVMEDYEQMEGAAD